MKRFFNMAYTDINRGDAQKFGVPGKVSPTRLLKSGGVLGVILS